MSLILSGTGYGAKSLLARAALLVDDGTGRMTISGDLLVEAAQRARRFDEPLQVILVGVDASYALLTRLPTGLTLGGIIAELDLPAPPSRASDLAILCGVETARESIPDGIMVLLDPVRGRAYVDPDAEDISRFQTGRLRERYQLTEAHLPAITQSGRRVSVWAQVYDRAGVECALAEGADGVVIDSPGELIPWDAEPEAILPELLRVAEMVGAGDIALLGSPETLDPHLLVSLAGYCRLHWLFSLDELTLPLSEFREELKGIVQAEEDERRPAGLPYLSALLSAVPVLESSEEYAGFDGSALYSFSDEDLSELILPTVLYLPPLRVRVQDIGEDSTPSPALTYAISAGTTGLIVAPEAVALAKDFIRMLD